MLNLNFNINGSNQKFLYRGNGQYVVRNDGFNQYIVVAVPGNLFQDTFGNNQFGMTNPWDDISSYVVTGQPNTPSGSNLVIYPSGSTQYIYPSASYTAFPVDTEGRYSASLALNGQTSLVPNKTWAAKEGANFTFSSSFVIETYAAFVQTASAFVPDPGNPDDYAFEPKRALAWKYVAGDPAQGQYLFDMWSGNRSIYPTINAVSGSTRFVFDITGSSNFTASATESIVYPQYSVSLPTFQFKHYAVAYSSESLDTDKQVRMYVDGVLIGSSSLTGSNYDLTQNTGIPLQIMGSVSALGYSSSLVMFNDFKIYNGTDKNYTGSSFVPPQSLAYWTGY